MYTSLYRRPTRSPRLQLLGCSMVALAAAIAGSAQADCLPTPPPSGPIVCSGATVGTVGISSNTTVTVQAGASLTRGNFDTGAVTVTRRGRPARWPP